MSKFKVGDKVKVIVFNKTGTIKKFDTYDDGPWAFIEFVDEHKFSPPECKVGFCWSVPMDYLKLIQTSENLSYILI